LSLLVHHPAVPAARPIHSNHAGAHGREERARYPIAVNDAATRRQKANPKEYEEFVRIGSTDPFENEPGRGWLSSPAEARSHHNTYDRPQIVCPVMIAAGKYDGIALPQSQHNMASRIAGAGPLKAATFHDPRPRGLPSHDRILKG
jgi:pimeloyl-ACP methyl ester carboxylesterase